MHQDVFEMIGLSPNEAKVYETLVSSGESSVSTISAKSNVHRRNMYDTLQRLVNKGLVFQIFQKGENLYRAVNPEKLMELLKEKEQRLATILPDLSKQYAQTPIEEAAYIYRGIEGYKNYRRDLLRISETSYFLGSKGLWLSPQIDSQFRATLIDPFTKKVDYYMLFDPRVRKNLPQAYNGAKKQSYRFLPDEYETQGVVDIFGDYVVTFTSVGIGRLYDNVTIFVMINRELAESYKTWFRFIWNACPSEQNGESSMLV